MKNKISLIVFCFFWIGSFSQSYSNYDRFGNKLKSAINFEFKVSENYTMVIANNKYGVKKADGSIFIEANKDAIYYLGLDFFIIRSGEMDFEIYKDGKPMETGEIKINAIYGYNPGFKFGFVDGYVCFPGAGSDIELFYVMDSTGQFLKTKSEPEFHPEFISFKKEKLIYNKKTGEYIDLKPVIGENGLGVFSEGIASVIKSDMPNSIGYINWKGEWIAEINPKINGSQEFDNGVCLVISKGEDKWINTSGKFVKRPAENFIKNVTFFQNFRITEDTYGVFKISDERTGKLVEGYFTSDHNMVNFKGYYTCGGYLFVKAGQEMAMIHHSGKVVHRFKKNYETKIYDLIHDDGDLISVKSDGGNTVVFNSEGEKLWEIPIDLACTISPSDIACYDKKYSDSVKAARKLAQQNVTTNSTDIKKDHTPVEYVFGIVMRKVRGTINVSVNYACRYFVVTDVSGEGPEEAMQYASTFNRINFTSDGYMELEIYATDDLDKCKKAVNEKYKLSDFKVEYITKD